jgi:hypothetical protein
MTAKVLGECPSETHTKVLVTERPITAYAILSKENIIAYSEKYSCIIHFIKWSPISGVITNLCQIEGRN